VIHTIHCPFLKNIKYSTFVILHVRCRKYVVDADILILLGECRIEKSQITTFDGVVYDPRFVDECQYMVVAATGPDDKTVILLDRGSNAKNQVGNELIYTRQT
jgi:hypothetical protein